MQVRIACCKLQVAGCRLQVALIFAHKRIPDTNENERVQECTVQVTRNAYW